MSDSSRHSLYAVVEGTYGTTPATPTLKTIRHVSCSLAITKGAMVSDELRSDRQVADFRHAMRQTGGEIAGELSFRAYDDLLEAVLGGTWTVRAAPYTAATISAASADNSINDSAAGFPAVVAGDKISIAGFTGTTGNNTGFATVVSRTASKIVVSGVTLVNDAAGESVTITPLSYVLKAGTTRRSFSVLRHFTDIADGDKARQLYKGTEFNTLKLNFTAGDDARVRVSFGCLGRDMELLTAAITGQSITAAPTGKMMDCLSGAVTEGGSTIAIVTEIQLNLENGLAVRPVVGSDKTLLPTIGRSMLTGQFTAYAEDGTLLQKFISETASSLSFLLTDPAGNAYAFSVPNISYTGAQDDVSGQGAVTRPLPFQAIYDETSVSQVVVVRHPAA